MTYKELLSGIEYIGTAPEGDTHLVVQDSRKVEPGAVFVCIQGRTSDGHEHAAKAVASGAGLVVTQRRLGLEGEVIVGDTRAAYARMSANYFGEPAKKMRLVAVTGTNGKTTVSTILQQVFEGCGKRCGLIGTAGALVGGCAIPAKFTTPEAWDLNALLARMVAAGCTHVVMEASSQALEQGRLFGLRFALGVFTNLTQDHLDYHGSMEEYYEAKKLLFAQCDAALVNLDDEWGRRLTEALPAQVRHGFGINSDAEYTASAAKYGPGGVEFELYSAGQQQAAHVRFGMPGAYSVYNALAVLGAAQIMGCKQQEAVSALALSRGVPGRCEVLYYNKEFVVVCDFAHTGDAMDKLLSALRPHVLGRMIVLYGCAGRRDAAKRPAMSAAAARYGDVVYLTSDNPRGEDPKKIAQDALEPLKQSGRTYFVMQDRESAVRAALAEVKPGDMLVLCGKGHEDYQVLDGVTVYLSERQIVRDALGA